MPAPWPNDFIKNNPDLKSEADLLPRAAELGKAGAVEYVMSMETVVGESWNLPDMDSKSGRFYGAPIAIVDVPFDGGRLVGGVGINRKDEQLRFFTSIKDKRFLELQKMTGAYQGKRPTNQNQLLDAFHLWCAELNGCEFFLTLDFTLIKVLKFAKKKSVVRAVRPSELLASIG